MSANYETQELERGGLGWKLSLLICSLILLSAVGMVAFIFSAEPGAVRKGDTVWVMQDGRLDIRDLEIVFQDWRYASITKGLEEGDQVVTTDLATVVEGTRLRLKGSGEALRSKESPDHGVARLEPGSRGDAR